MAEVARRCALVRGDRLAGVRNTIVLATGRRELGAAGLRGRPFPPPTVEPDPGNAGGGSDQTRIDGHNRQQQPNESRSSSPALIRGKRHHRSEALVIGGGLIGLSAAWRLAQSGVRTTLLERERIGAGASGVAAGMLAPVTELDYAETRALAARLAALDRWPAFAAELAAHGCEPGLLRCGSVLCAVEPDDLGELRRLRDLQRSLGVEVEWLDRRALRAHEPALGPRALAGLWVASEGAVDPRATLAALAVAARRAGAAVIENCPVVRLERTRGAIVGVHCADGRSFGGDLVVLAAGAWSRELARSLGIEIAVRPVKGQLLVLGPNRGRAELPTHVVRTLRVYCVPRRDGRMVVGATVEERGFDRAVTAGAVRSLLDEAWTVVPGIEEAELLEVLAGHRPATPDNEPLLGFDPEIENLLWATGHWRNGVLWVPLAGEAVVSLVYGREPPVELVPFDPRRLRSPELSARGSGRGADAKSTGVR